SALATRKSLFGSARVMTLLPSLHRPQVFFFSTDIENPSPSDAAWEHLVLLFHFLTVVCIDLFYTALVHSQQLVLVVSSDSSLEIQFLLCLCHLLWQYVLEILF